MGLRQWWARRKQVDAANRKSLEINDDERAIAEHAPELSGLGYVAGAAYVLREIDAFMESAAREDAAELAGRLIASQSSWTSEGLTMPYWGNLVVLRRLQDEIGARGGSNASMV